MPIKFLSKITGKDATDRPINISKIEGLVDSSDKFLLDRLPEIPPAMVAAEPVGTTTIAIAAHENTTSHPLVSQTTKGMMSGTDKTKLDGIATQATKNLTDAELLARQNHTGTQAIVTISGLQTALDSKQNVFTAQNPGLVFAAPIGNVAAVPAFRALTERDLPGATPYYRGTTAPTNPAIGTVWDELTSSGQFIHTWFWNGTYWLSKQIFFKEASLNNAGTTTTLYYEITQDYNVFVLFFKTNFLIGIANTASANWAFSLSRVNLNNISSAITTSAISTSAAPINTWFTFAQQLNSHINVSTTGARAFAVTATRNGNPSNISGSMQIAYRLARI